MPDLIAQGPRPDQRWRRALVDGVSTKLGRDAGVWSVPWDQRISRHHCEIRLRGEELEVRRLDSARNPIFVSGREQQQFKIHPSDHFVIGETTFTFVVDRAQVGREGPAPLEEQTFSAQYLQRVRYRNAEQRLEVLSRMPEVISGATTDAELFVRLVNLVLSGIPRANVVALTNTVVDAAGVEHIQVLYWDRRLHSGGDFQPSRRLILEALEREQSVLHVWNTAGSTGSGNFTMSDEADWAFATPISGEACKGWTLYVAGRYHGHAGLAATPSDPTDLREDVKFAELVAALVAALRQTEQFRKRQAVLSNFFAPAVMGAMQSADPELVLTPREADVCVMFCDLRGFTRTAQRSADDLLGLLERVSRALGVMTHQILEQGGVLGDFHGDAAMGFWGWPLMQEDAVDRACCAALAVRKEFELAGRTPGHPLADFRMGMGLASGRAVAGRIGTVDQVKVTVFGPVVNLAARLEGMTKLVQSPILLDEPTAAAVRKRVPATTARVRRVARVRPYGTDGHVEISELLPPADEPGQMTDEQVRQYEQALEQFIAGHWSEALETLHGVPARDRVKDFLTVFIAQHGRTPPQDWDGVIPLSSKG
jgi:adenylate cyclase